MLAVKKFRVYLAGNRFDLITDHRALALVNQSLDLNDVQRRRGKWLEFFQQYPFNPLHRAGKSPELAMADYLSCVGHGEQVAALRMASLAMYQAETDSAYRLFQMLSENDIREAQRTCPAVGKYLEAREAGKTWINPVTMKQGHCGKHVRRDRTWDRVRTMVWWPGVQSDVAMYVAGCDTCQRAKHSRKGKAPLKKTEVSDQPFQRIQIDIVGPIQASVPVSYVSSPFKTF